MFEWLRRRRRRVVTHAKRYYVDFQLGPKRIKFTHTVPYKSDFLLAPRNTNSRALPYASDANLLKLLLLAHKIDAQLSSTAIAVPKGPPSVPMIPGKSVPG